MSKKLISLVFVFLLPVSLSAFSEELVFPLKLWLLNNEARTLHLFAADSTLIQHLSSPFSFVPKNAKLNSTSENKLLDTNRKIYSLLDEIQEVYEASSRFGNGRLGILTYQYKPDYLVIFAALCGGGRMADTIFPFLRISYTEAFLRTLNLDPKRDINLSQRLKNAFLSLTDSETRLFKYYLEAFAALHPKDNSVKIINALIVSAARPNFAQGIHSLLTPAIDLNISSYFQNQESAPFDVESELQLISSLLSGDTPQNEIELEADYYDTQIDVEEFDELVETQIEYLHQSQPQSAYNTDFSESEHYLTEDIFDIWGD